MVIKMIILEFVLILGFSSVVRCFPSSKGDRNIINDANQTIAKTDANESDIEERIPQNVIIANLLKNQDFDHNSIPLDYAKLHEFCNFSNWELNNTHTKSKNITEPPNEIDNGIESSENYPSNDNQITNESSQEDETSKIKYQTPTQSGEKATTSEYKTVTSKSANDGKIQRRNQSADTRDFETIEDDPDGGVFIRILLLLILMLQNVFLFIMVLFYRSMKKTSLKCDNLRVK